MAGYNGKLGELARKGGYDFTKQQNSQGSPVCWALKSSYVSFVGCFCSQEKQICFVKQ